MPFLPLPCLAPKMDIVNPTTDNEKLVTTTTSHALGDGIENGATGKSQAAVTSKQISGDVEVGHINPREGQLQSPTLSIDVAKTLNHTDEEPPVIVQLPDLRTAPSLRGRMLVEGNMHKCQGVWAMNDNSHSIPGQTSDFELRLLFPGVAPSEVPVDGRYTGWFMLKNPQKNTATKIDDRDLDIKFTKNENNSDYTVSGGGVNKFGKFSLQGTLKSNNMIQLYKIYQPKRVGGATPRGSVGGSPRPRGTAASLSRQSTALSTSISSPRESSGRVRRPSLAMSESLAPMEKTSSASVNKPPTAQRSNSKQTNKISSAVATSSVASSRSSRPPPFVSKCKEVLKDMGKQVSAIYFADAVDYVKFGIPDYPTIIKEPMDFGTIRLNLDKQLYKTHEMFADHMRLVFKNAITYNVRRDNPVHIAARELSDLFEERYRVMVSQLGVNAYTSEIDASMTLTRQPSATGSRKSAGKSGRGRSSQGGPGPRAMEVPPPPALDGSMQQMMLMHQKMLDMEQELNSLRTAVRQTEIRTSLDQQRVAAQIPLSYDEKKALIENIQRLDGDQITSVVDIIQSAMPSTDCGGEGDEVEIPMDELDTYTLRQLQDFVHSVQQQAISVKRKRQSMSSSSSITPRTPKGKKAKSSSVPVAAAIPAVAHTIPAPPHQQVSAAPVSTSNNSDDDTVNEGYPHGRKRSNSLDLFPSLDEMEQDPAITTAKNGSEKSYEAWTAANGSDSNSCGTKGAAAFDSVSGSWGEAVSERKDSLYRESEMKDESQKMCEQRAKVKSDRDIALQRAYEKQSSQSSSCSEHSKEKDLLAQRELERTKRAEMSQTVEFDESHDALYRESFDL